MPERGDAIVIGIGQFRSDARNYVHRALAGETFTVLRRGLPVVELRATNYRHCEGATRISLAAARTRASTLFERVAAGEIMAIEQVGETIATLQPYRL
jgi:antitoxin (DNA-binding transcriptional repressor) of toxin-antitoxin stability system